MRRHRLLLGAALGLALAILLLVVAGPLRTRIFHGNLHRVGDGIYRSGTPSTARLEAWIGELGLRTVVNLRERGEGRPWYEEQRALARQHGLAFHTVGLSGDRLPTPASVRALVAVLDEAPRPLLMHCQGGAERTGLVAALAVLLDGGDLADARAQFDLEHGYIDPLSEGGLPRMLDDYERWLAAQGLAHAPEQVRAWAESGYVPSFYRARIEALDAPRRVAQAGGATLRFRVTNESPRAIPLTARERRSGVHLGAHLSGPSGIPERQLRGRGAGGALAPGDSRELELVLPRLPAPGRYRLEVDLVHEGVKWFAAMGSETLVLELEAGP
ncbi:MAG: tyrosine-protein phosphatase [Myxococcota bacterium]|nr:tyrosine-protein phosphatase [Myxococcota bacterium]